MSSSRRTFLMQVGTTVGGLTLAGRHAVHAASPPSTPVSAPDKPDGAAVLRDLLEGNTRFVAGQMIGPRRTPEDFSALAEG